MILSDKAKNAITTRCQNLLAVEFNCHSATVGRWIKENENNGDLTKAKAVQIISKETGLPENEILVEVLVSQPQN